MKKQFENFLNLTRAKRQNLNNSSFASFNPSTFGLDFSKPYSILHYSDELEDEDDIISFIRGTYMHERVHWMQFMGSSIGLIKQLNQIQFVKVLNQFLSRGKFEAPLSEFITKLLNDEIDSHEFVSQITPESIGDDYSASDVLNNLITLIENLEYFDFIIDGTDIELTKLKSPGVNLKIVYSQLFGHFLKNGFLKNPITLINSSSEKQEEQPNEITVTQQTIQLLLDFAFQNEKSAFVLAADGINTYFSSFHIFEAQARLVDMNKVFRSLIHQKKSEQEINATLDEYISQQPYAYAYNLFLETFDVEISKDYQRVFFLIACEYAINPITPPLFEIDILYFQGVNHFLPPTRFLSICKALKKISETKINLQHVEEFEETVANNKDGKIFNIFDSIANYNDFIKVVFGWIKEETGYPTPTEVSQLYLDKVDVVLKANQPMELGINTIPLSLFRNACKLRIEQPIYFVDCAVMEAIDRKLYLECCSSFQYYIFKEEEVYKSKYPSSILDGIISHQILSKFLEDIIYDSYSDLSFFKNYEGVTEEIIIEKLQGFFKMDISSFIKFIK